MQSFTSARNCLRRNMRCFAVRERPATTQSASGTKGSGKSSGVEQRSASRRRARRQSFQGGTVELATGFSLGSGTNNFVRLRNQRFCSPIRELQPGASTGSGASAPRDPNPPGFMVGRARPSSSGAGKRLLRGTPKLFCVLSQSHSHAQARPQHVS